MAVTKVRRCGWGESDPMYLRYHDKEWGVPVHNDRRLFEMLILEGTQAGLSWLIVLRKREEYRKAFDNFDASRIARYTEKKIQKLLSNPGIVRNRLKIVAAIDNAKAFLKIQKEFGSFNKFLWSFVGGKPRQNRFKRLREISSRTPESDAMSRDLKKRGFRFVGSTICYAFMQAVGMVNDHLVSCYRHREIAANIKNTIK